MQPTTESMKLVIIHHLLIYETFKLAKLIIRILKPFIFSKPYQFQLKIILACTSSVFH